MLEKLITKCGLGVAAGFVSFVNLIYGAIELNHMVELVRHNICKEFGLHTWPIGVYMMVFNALAVVSILVQVISKRKKCCKPVTKRNLLYSLTLVLLMIGACIRWYYARGDCWDTIVDQHPDVNRFFIYIFVYYSLLFAFLTWVHCYASNIRRQHREEHEMTDV